jgi:hypothetical protein
VKRLATWTLLAVAATIVSAQTQTDRIESKMAGIAAVKPHGWQIAVQQSDAVQVPARLDDPSLFRVLPKGGAIRLFVIARHAEPYTAGPNPSIQIILRPIGDLQGKSAVEILRASVETLKKAFPDFRFVSEIKATTIGGLPGASMRSAYTLYAENGSNHPLETGLVIVPRGAMMFLIGTASPQSGADASQKEFDAFMRSVVIQP